jgi:hypothetical protein
MRCTALAWLVVCGLWLTGCGGSGGSTTAGAGAPGGPPPPPGAPAPPGEAGPPQEGAPPDAGQPPAEEGSSTPPASDAPPEGGLPTPGTPDAPGTPGTPGEGTASTGTPAEGASPDGGQPGQPGDPNPDGTPRQPPRPLTLREQAIAAFRTGNEPLEAQRLLYAYYGFAAEAKDELAQKMGWFPALIRPALGPRVGIAVQYSETSRTFTGNPMPIGSSELTQAVQQLAQSGGAEAGSGSSRRSRIGGGEGGAGGQPGEGGKSDSMSSAGGPEQLTFYTGEFGEMLLEALEDRLGSGAYGTVPQELMKEIARQPRSNDPNDAAAGEPQLAPPEDAPASGRRRRGGGEEGGQDGAPAGGKTRRWSSKTGAGDAVSVQQHVKQLSPSVLWLGKADERDAINKRAEAADVDILAIFDMSVREARGGGLVNTTTRLRLFNVRQGMKALPEFNSEALNNREVELWRQKEQRSIDPVEREVTRAIDALDKVLKPTELPAGLNSESAKRRIASLVAAKPAEPLPAVVEARFYAAKGLIAEEDYTKAGVSLLGQSGFTQLQEKAKPAVP